LGFISCACMQEGSANDEVNRINGYIFRNIHSPPWCFYPIGLRSSD